MLMGIEGKKVVGRDRAGEEIVQFSEAIYAEALHISPVQTSELRLPLCNEHISRDTLEHAT